VTVTEELEADIAPRPNGNNRLSITDWVQAGRFVAGLDTVSTASEFMRADCAPRSTLGNGAIKITDWVQAGRYVAGLDALTLMGGSAGAFELQSVGPSDEARNANRVLRSVGGNVRRVLAGRANGQVGRLITIPIELEARGDENAIGFSLGFDPSVLRFESAELGEGLSGAVLNVNVRGSKDGRIGIAIAKRAGELIAAGEQNVVRMGFWVLALGSANLTFDDEPVTRGKTP